MKRCIFNTFRHQVTKDEDVVPMDKSELTSFGLITTYMLKAKAKHTGMMDMKAIEKAMRLAPYFDMYLEQAEKVLRKPRQQFTDDEKDRCINEFMDIYEGANRMLDKCLIFNK